MTLGGVLFLVKDDHMERENKINGFVSAEPAIAVILAAVHFGWMIRRAIIALGVSPNKKIHEQLRCCHGLGKLKDAWKDEVKQRTQKGIAEVTAVWPQLKDAFALRNRLVHGVKPTSNDYAERRVEWLLQAARDIQQFCKTHEVDLYRRLPVRRKGRTYDYLLSPQDRDQLVP